jgi:hypothetical protein
VQFKIQERVRPSTFKKFKSLLMTNTSETATIGALALGSWAAQQLKGSIQLSALIKE